MTALLIVLGAGPGAALRFWAASHLDGTWPRGTLLVNVTGSFLLGLLSALALGDHTMALLGVGFCGGFTTYSSVAVQARGLGPRHGAAYAAATIGLALAACAGGFALAA